MIDGMVSAPLWRRMLAGFLDVITAFFGFGLLVGKATGGLTENGFSLEGGPALLMMALVAGYFILGGRYLGGTIWQRLLGARSRPAASA